MQEANSPKSVRTRRGMTVSIGDMIEFLHDGYNFICKQQQIVISFDCNKGVMLLDNGIRVQINGEDFKKVNKNGDGKFDRPEWSRSNW